MQTPKSIVLFVPAAIAGIGGAWLIWQGVREHKGWLWIGAGVIALGADGFVATLQPDADFGRILAACGGVLAAGSLVWGVALDGFRPDRYDVTGTCVRVRRHRTSHTPSASNGRVSYTGDRADTA